MDKVRPETQSEHTRARAQHFPDTPAAEDPWSAGKMAVERQIRGKEALGTLIFRPGVIDIFSYRVHLVEGRAPHFYRRVRQISLRGCR
jgi:hypothetical protein